VKPCGILVMLPEIDNTAVDVWVAVVSAGTDILMNNVARVMMLKQLFETFLCPLYAI